jgi:RND family efflux transporter MFP subunit
MKRKWIVFILLSFMIIIIQCNQKGAGKIEEQAAVPVKVMEVSMGEVRQSLTFHGDIKAEVQVKVFAKIPDRIEAFFVDDGDYIKKGDPIAKIMATAIEQAVLQAEAGLIAAKAQEANLKIEYERAQRLNKENAISQQQYDGVQTQYEAIAAQTQQAEAAYNTAKSQLNDATITAPISGIIGKRYYEAGDMATPVQPVVSIVQMNKVKIIFDATEEDLGRLAIGQEANVRVRSYPDHIFSGKVKKISPVLDPMTRLANVEVLIPNSDQKLKPGMFAEAEITVGVLQDAMVVPRFAVIENTSLIKIDGLDKVQKNYFVYVVNDSNYSEQRKLVVDYVNHIQIAVKEGVEVGEKIVMEGHNNLREGMPVHIVDEEEEK